MTPPESGPTSRWSAPFPGGVVIRLMRFWMRRWVRGESNRRRGRIAGDELDPDDPEMRVAVGFLRMGPWEHTGMSVAKVTRQQWLDDVTDSVGQVFLAHALQCARCHDHKFDPVPTRDYYAIQAVFATTQIAEVEVAWIEDENRAGMAEDRAYFERRLEACNEMKGKVRRAREAGEAAWFAERGFPWTSRAEAKKAGAKPDQLPPKDAALTH